MPFLTRRRLLTVALSGFGVVAFEILQLPLPFLLGPLAACLVGALAGAPLQDMGGLGRAMRAVLGVAVGASITPELAQRLPEMAYSVALVPLFVLAIWGVGYPFFRKVCGYDVPTAYYAAVPGGLQEMLLFGEEAGAKVRTLTLVHATRVLTIVTLAPLLITGIWDVPLTEAPGAPVFEVPLLQLGLMVGSGLFGWWAAEKVRLFGAAILGPMIVSALLSLSGLLTFRPPAEAILAAQFIIGAGIGAAYLGVTFAELRRDVSAGLGFCLVLALITFVFAEGVALSGFAPPLEAFLAFAPGGQAEMVVLALVAGADLAFVVTHHLVRLVVVLLGAPIVAGKAMAQWKRKGDAGRNVG